MNAGLSHARRGVLLLLVLGLLALFALVAVAFVIVSGQSQRSSRIMQRLDQTLIDPQKQLNEAMMQVARGPSNYVSVIGPHSLLEDMYGNTSVYAHITSATPVIKSGSSATDGQLIEITYELASPNVLYPTGTPPWIADPNPQYRRLGCLVTILDSNMMGESTRIVGIDPSTGLLQLLATNKVTASNINSYIATTSQYPRILVNGAPFSGTGFGFNPATGKLDLKYVIDPKNPKNLHLTTDTTYPFQAALLPNMPLGAYLSSNPPDPNADPLVVNPLCNPPGGANEDYDAADYQNMVLGTPTLPTLIAGNIVLKNIPSLHRPALVNYWFNELANDPSGKGYEATFWNSTGLTPSQKTSALQSASTVADPIAHQNIINFKRRIILRPLAEDNPDFTGSNPWVTSAAPWDPINGPWDVDNDGDGVADSIWVDLGFPVRAAKDGKLFKPLFAILCLDMDGRLNLNAHGDLQQAGFPTQTCTTFAANNFAGGTPPTTSGRGFGPADVNLKSILPLSPINLYQQLLSGNGIYEGRYGTDYDINGNIVQPPRPGTAGSAAFSKLGNPSNLFTPTTSSYNDYLFANKWYEFDGLYQNSATKQAPASMKSLASFKIYGELPDPEGRGATGVDPAGRPILQNLWMQDPLNPTNLIPNDYLDLPYELNLGWKTGRGLPTASGAPDNPFSVNELERILRPYDRDAASLPARLAALTFDPLQNKSVLIDKRQEVTTESWDVPVFSPALPPHILTRVQSDLAAGNITANQISWLPPHHVTDLLKAYYYYQLRNSATPLSPIDAAVQANNMVNALTTAQLMQLFPPEMLAGLRMNINRPFPGWGNGQTSDPSAYGMAALWQSLGVGGSYGDFWFGQMPDYPDGTNDANNAPFAARQRYARYLYVLALLLRDPNTDSQWFTETFPTPGPGVPDYKEQLNKRRIAQWAINAACFKVNDSIMAAFEYDTDPLGYTGTTINGWRVDGIIDATSADNIAAYRGLVWGCKPPELILTETLAFHDRRIADTTWDGATNTTVKFGDITRDQDFDQTRVPQGSAFFELYCPRDFHGSTPPADLYNASGQLDLGRLSPADAHNRQYPVWRIVIGASNIVNTQNNALSRFASNTDSFVPQPQQYRDAPSYLQYTPNNDETTLFNNSYSGSTAITIDRIIWFANLPPVAKTADSSFYHADADRIYYNYPGTAVSLDRGHYAMVGPRRETTLGLVKLASTDPDYANYPLGVPSFQKITIPAPNSPQVTDINGTPDPNIDQNKIKMPLGIIVGNTPSGWSTQVGISVSEPLFSSGSYYPQPTVAGTGKYALLDIFNNPVKEWYGDPQMKDPAVGYFRNTPLDKDASRPLGDPSEQLPYAGTVSNYRTVFLQRLANPSAAYDPATNPYLTVDWMPIDLTIFKGGEDSWITFDPDMILSPNPVNIYFTTRQRGKTTSDFNIWKPESDDPGDVFKILDPAYYNVSPEPEQKKALTNAYFDFNLIHSLGYLNRAFQPFITGNTIGYNGDPATKPFPWLPWFGRPYVNQLELMLVPGSHPARLLWEFQPCTSGTNNYTPASKDLAPYPQLLNFLQSGNANRMNQFGRILDYVGVPSWFAGTEIQANPTAASSPISTPGTHTFFPPYNKISTYREPGRINLNTIYSQDVFNGLLNGNTSPTWTQFSTSRGDNYPVMSPLSVMNPLYPTEIAHPFRTCGGGSMVPELDDTSPSGLGNDYLKPKYEIDASYMRQDPTAANNPLFQTAPAQAVFDTNRNPFFHYQDLERLGNLVTTRSNAYAVWITVGYFEAKPNRFTTPAGLPDAAHPDGYELGQELGSDTGEIVRHRAFYMIDRTIPVGFQRGQDLNVEKAIILKRYIE